VIGTDIRTEPAIGHSQVVRHERVVDRDPKQREVGRPARLATEAEPGVAEPRVLEEVGEKR
jgi:hypothetical protein